MSAHDKEYIFNIGWNRTGTRTLNDCLKALGIKGSHWNPTKHLCAEWAWKNWNEFEEFVITHNYESYADAPWCFPELYKHLDKFFPNAKFILTIREEDKWINSYKNLYENHHKGHEKLKEIPMIANKEEYGWVHPLIFGGKKIITGNEEVYRKIYSTHNNQVKNYFKGREGKLFIIDFEKNNASWGRICKFLNKPIPKTPFPWRKDTRKTY